MIQPHNKPTDSDFLIHLAASIAAGGGITQNMAVAMSFVESLAHKEAMQRLDALQRDNFKVDLADLSTLPPSSSSSSAKNRKRTRPSGDDDDDGDAHGNRDDDDNNLDGGVGGGGGAPDSPGSKKRRGRMHLRTVRSLQQLLEEAGTDAMPPHVPTYITATAAPSRLPKRSFCTNCGYFAKYTCTRCAQKYCSLTCNQAHVEEKRCR